MPKHWHTANETYTIVSVTFIMEHIDGQRHELGPGSFDYVPAKAVHQAWTKTDEGAFHYRRWSMGCELGRWTAESAVEMSALMECRSGSLLVHRRRAAQNIHWAASC